MGIDHQKSSEPYPSRADDRKLVGIRGWLLAYLVLFIYLMLHGLGLTLASITLYSVPSLGAKELHRTF